MKELIPSEELVMKQTFKATMLRAANIIDAITDEDVADAQIALFKTGAKLKDISKVDRALIASCHLRACVEMKFGAEERVRAEAILKHLQDKVKP